MIISSFRRIYGAAAHRPRLPDDEVARHYPRFRFQVLQAAFLGYTTFYLVRNNLSVVAKDMEQGLHYSHGMIGTILMVTAASYGIGKFLMGALSDRCNPRTFMASGLLLTACCNFGFGTVRSFPLHLLLWGLNGLFQGMGWAPCGRAMGHWFGQRERGLTFSIWNSSTNVGGGLAGLVAAWAAGHFGGWQYAFYFPGVLAVLGAVYLLVMLRDTPQSVGLPPIEEYQALSCRRDLADNREPGTGNREQLSLDSCFLAPDPCPLTSDPCSLLPDAERELGTRELLFDVVLRNKYIWLLALCNLFVYITRYSMLDWGPMYLREMKGASRNIGGLGVFMTDWGGIAPTILLGWVSDLIGGRRGLVAMLCLIPVLGAFLGILWTPPGYLWLDMILLAAIGFFVYPVLNLILILALDVTSKKAIGAAAGFIGLFGYLGGRTLEAQGIGWMLDHFGRLYGPKVAWEIVLQTILGCAATCIVLLAFTWRIRPRAAAEGEPVTARGKAERA